MARSAVSFENRATKSYLVAYNVTQFFGWLFVLLKLLEDFVVTLNFRTSYATVGALVMCSSLVVNQVNRRLAGRLQLIACLEVLHAGLGLVRSAPLTAFMQWAGRSHVLLAIIAKLPEVQPHFSVFLTFAAWSLTEVIRYPQYGLSGLGVCPRWLTWLRYTTFIVLYPAGIYGEMLTMFSALGPIQEHDLYAKFFNKLPFQYDTFVTGLLMVYPLLFLVLYRHMFKQRWAKLTRQRPAVRRGRTESSRGRVKNPQGVIH